MRSLLLAVGCLTMGSCADRQPDDWLEGRWAVDRQSCDEAGLTYHEDGTWSDFLGMGTWRREGLNLRTSRTHNLTPLPRRHAVPIAHPLCHQERLQRIGTDELSTTWEDTSVHRLHRCLPTEVPFPHRECIGDCERVTAFDESPWNTGSPAATRSCSR